MELAPFLAGGCRGFVGPYPSTPLDAYCYVVRSITNTVGSSKLCLESGAGFPWNLPDGRRVWASVIMRVPPAAERVTTRTPRCSDSGSR